MLLGLHLIGSSVRLPARPAQYMQIIGNHQVEIAGDTLLVRWVGTPTLEEMQSIGALYSLTGDPAYKSELFQAAVLLPVSFKVTTKVMTGLGIIIEV